MRKKIEEKIRKKESELAKAREEFDRKNIEGQAYIQAMQDMLKMLPKEEKIVISPEKVLKPGSGPRKTYDLLKTEGKPMHISDIMKAIGLEVNKENRATLASSLNLYVTKNQIFTRPAPGTFGLITMELEDTEESGLPDNFGGGEEESEELTELDPF